MKAGVAQGMRRAAWPTLRTRVTQRLPRRARAALGTGIAHRLPGRAGRTRGAGLLHPRDGVLPRASSRAGLSTHGLACESRGLGLGPRCRGAESTGLNVGLARTRRSEHAGAGSTHRARRTHGAGGAHRTWSAHRTASTGGSWRRTARTAGGAGLTRRAARHASGHAARLRRHPRNGTLSGGRAGAGLPPHGLTRDGSRNRTGLSAGRAKRRHLRRPGLLACGRLLPRDGGLAWGIGNRSGTAATGACEHGGGLRRTARAACGARLAWGRGWGPRRAGEP